MLAKLTDSLVALGTWGVLAVAFVDSAGIPLSVGLDALIIVLAWKSPATAVWNVLLAVTGSAAGTMVLFYLARKGGERYLKREVPEGRRKRFRQWFHRYGLLTVFIPTLVPIPMPMKAFVILSGALGIRPLSFLACVVTARVMRYGGEAWLGVQLGADSAKFLSEHRWHLVIFTVVLFAILYLLARWRASRVQNSTRTPA